ncbi:MAG: hypothetical protein R2688_05010 [Fimbriimonadaceae bacterium]
MAEISTLEELSVSADPLEPEEAYNRLVEKESVVASVLADFEGAGIKRKQLKCWLIAAYILLLISLMPLVLMIWRIQPIEGYFGHYLPLSLLIAFAAKSFFQWRTQVAFTKHARSLILDDFHQLDEEQKRLLHNVPELGKMLEINQKAREVTA